jgi:hypothetical protein
MPRNIARKCRSVRSIIGATQKRHGIGATHERQGVATELTGDAMVADRARASGVTGTAAQAGIERGVRKIAARESAPC